MVSLLHLFLVSKAADSECVVIPLNNKTNIFSSKFMTKIKKQMETRRKTWTSQNKRMVNKSPLITVKDFSKDRNDQRDSSIKPIIKMEKSSLHPQLVTSSSKHFVDNIQYLRRMSMSSKQSKVKRDSEGEEKSTVPQQIWRINPDNPSIYKCALSFALFILSKLNLIYWW